MCRDQGGLPCSKGSSEANGLNAVPIQDPRPILAASVDSLNLLPLPFGELTVHLSIIPAEQGVQQENMQGSFWQDRVHSRTVESDLRLGHGGTV